MQFVVSHLFALLDKIKSGGGKVYCRWNENVKHEYIHDRLAELGLSADSRFAAVFSAFKGGGEYTYEITLKYGVLGSDRTFSGGAQVGDIFAVRDWLQSCRAWAEDTWIADYEEERELWATSFPFARLANGDYLALNPKHESGVVYLQHDNCSCVIAASFEEFFDNWTQLFLIGPELSILKDYMDSDSNYLSAKSPRALELLNYFTSI